MSKPTTPEKRFVAGLDKAIEFHKNNTNDPYGTSVAVITAMLEVRNAFVEAYGIKDATLSDSRNCA